MIRGAVDSRLEASVPIEVLGPQGQKHTITAVIDTGYNGALTLPTRIVTALSLPPLVSGQVTLADVSQRSMRFYVADVLWDGRMRKIGVLCADVDPLVGTALLRGYRIEADFVSGGSVAIISIREWFLGKHRRPNPGARKCSCWLLSCTPPPAITPCSPAGPPVDPPETA